MSIQSVSNHNESNEHSQNPKASFILKVMEEEFGCIAAHAILSHVSRTTMKSMAEILSDYDTFSRILKEVYTEAVAETEILDRLSSFGLRKKSSKLRTLNSSYQMSTELPNCRLLQLQGRFTSLLSQ